MDYHNAIQYIKQHSQASSATKSGLYIIQPARSRANLFKFGLTKNIDSRFYSAYHTYWPDVDGPWRVVAWLTVPESQLISREADLLRLSAEPWGAGFGFRQAAVADKEWRISTSPRPMLYNNIELLFNKIRHKAVDGKGFIFKGPSAGDIVTIGARPVLDHSAVLPPNPRVTTRAAAARGARQTGEIEIDANQAYVNSAGGRRLRDLPRPAPPPLMRQNARLHN